MNTATATRLRSLKPEFQHVGAHGDWAIALRSLLGSWNDAVAVFSLATLIGIMVFLIVAG